MNVKGVLVVQYLQELKENVDRDDLFCYWLYQDSNDLYKVDQGLDIFGKSELGWGFVWGFNVWGRGFGFYFYVWEFDNF